MEDPDDLDTPFDREIEDQIILKPFDAETPQAGQPRV
jgi:hypothetical protein